MAELENIFENINRIIWGPLGVICILSAGVLITFRLRFFQVTHLFHWLSSTVGSLFKKRRKIRPFKMYPLRKRGYRQIIHIFRMNTVKRLLNVIPVFFAAFWSAYSSHASPIVVTPSWVSLE